MPQYAILIYAGDSAHSEEGTRDDARSEAVEDCDSDAEVLEQAGVMRVAYALRPRDTATAVRSEGITDGPFIDAKDVLAGFCVIDVPDYETALKYARSNSAVKSGGGVEVRPIAEGGVIDPAE